MSLHCEQWLYLEYRGKYDGTGPMEDLGMEIEREEPNGELMELHGVSIGGGDIPLNYQQTIFFCHPLKSMTNI